MPVNLQQYRGAAGAFNSCCNLNNIHNSVFHRKPNISSIANACFAILINFCTFLLVLKCICLIVLFRENIKTTNLMATKFCLSIFYQLICFIFAYFWLGLNEEEILNRTLDLNLIFVKFFLFVTGISAAFSRTILSNYPY